MFSSLEKKIIFILALVQFNHIVDFMIIMPLGPQLMRLFSIQPDQFSLLVSSYTFMAGVSGFLASFYTDKFDRKKSLFFMFIGFTVSTAFCGLAKNYETLLIARSLTGFFGGVMNSMVLSIVSDLIEYKRRGTAMGVLSTAFSMASILGVPFSLYLAQFFDWHAPFTFLASLCVIILFGVYKYIPNMNKHLEYQQEPNTSFWTPVVDILTQKTSIISLIFMFFVMFSHFSIIPFISPAYVANVGISEKDLALVYLVGGICSFFTAPFVGRLSDRMGKAKIFIYSVLFSFIPVYLVTHQGKDGLFLTLLFSGLFFISAGARMIPAQALVSASVPTEQRGAFMSLLSCTQSIAMAFGTYVAGHIITKDPVTGHLNNYTHVGYMAIAVGLITLFLVRKIRSHEHRHTHA